MKTYISSLFERRRARAAYRELLAMDDHVLTDMGMNRYELQTLARSGKTASRR